jgi:hypothetical protein
MMAIAIGIPVVIAVIVALAYLSFGENARVQGFIDQAEKEITLAHEAGGLSESTRHHWEAALEYAIAAVALRPDNPAATALKAQAQAALDFLDGIVRLQPVRLWDFGSGASPRRLFVHGQMIFVLDPAGGWVSQLTLNPAGDGVVEQGEAPILVQSGQHIDGEEVGPLVDFAWAGPAGEGQANGLLIVEEGGAVINYDPAWVDESGTPRLTRSLLGTPPAGVCREVESFGGRLYVLDPVAEQIWRYEPRGYFYPDQPDHYLVVQPPRSLEDAVDIAIDGNVYVLYADGTILKFMRGELQPFDVQGLSNPIGRAIVLAIAPEGGSGLIYLADQGSRRVVVLDPDGAFHAQFRADEAFDALESLAVDEAAKRLYVISDGELFMASLP